LSLEAGARHYETLCWRQINQTVGRVVRHAGDYACVVLADARYAARPAVTKNQLPNWIARSLKTPENSTTGLGKELNQFFARHSAKN